MKKRRRKRTPDDDAYFAWRKEADERLRRLREVVARGMAELEEKRRREARESS